MTGGAACTRRPSQLGAALASLGFASYDHFMQAALAAELAERCGTSRRPAPLSRLEGGRSTIATLDALAHASHVVDGQLGALFASVDDFLQLIKALDEKAAFLLDLSSNVHLVSLNALISSCRLAHGGEGLAVVTQNLATQSHDSMETMLGDDPATPGPDIGTPRHRLQPERGQARDRDDGVLPSTNCGERPRCRARGDDRSAWPRSRRRLATVRRSSHRRCLGAGGRSAARAAARPPGTADLQRLSSLHMLGKIQAGFVESGGASWNPRADLLTTARGHPEPARAARRHRRHPEAAAPVRARGTGDQRAAPSCAAWSGGR